MRTSRMALLVAGTLIAGCSSFKDVFTSHAETAARVGNRELTSARVADIISKLGGPTANPQAAELVTGIWVDASLFADQVASRTLKTDSATIDKLLWPQLAEQKVTTWHDSLVARRGEPTAATADSAFSAGELRLFQHILVVPTGPTAADTAKAKATADRVAAQAKGGDFGRLAAQYSSDGSKSDLGFLPVSGRGAFVPAFENPAWELQPGQVTGVVKSEFGFHIIRRPTMAESRDRFVAQLKRVQQVAQDSTYMDELTRKNEVVVKPGAGGIIRGAMSDLASARKSSKAIVAMKGGDLKVSDMVLWLDALPAQAQAQIRAANDTLLEQFAKTLAQNTLLLKQADSAKVTVNPTMYQGLQLQYRTQITQITEAIGLNGPEFSDSAKTTVAERRELAAKKVEEYFDKLVNGQAQFRAMPPTLSAELRDGGDYKIYQAGVSRAIELIVQKKSADSAAAAKAPPAAPEPPPGSLQPAPGGPPGQTPKP